MGCDKIRNQVEGDPPPNSAKDVTGEFFHAAEEADGVVNLGEVLK